MSYSEKDGQVILSMSREDYQMVLITLGYAGGAMNSAGDDRSYRNLYALLNRLNEGNPNFKK